MRWLRSFFNRSKAKQLSSNKPAELDSERQLMEAQIARLPRWAKVAFAARCARRVLPFFDAAWPGAGAEFKYKVDKTLALAEEAAAHASPVQFLDDADYASEDVYRTVLWAANAARAAASKDDGALTNEAIGTSLSASYAAEKYIINSFRIPKDYEEVKAEARAVVPGIRRDLQRLSDASSEFGWTDETPVSADVFDRL